MVKFEEILQKRQNRLFHFLEGYFREKVLNKRKGKYLVVKGNTPILLVAHLDTVHHELPITICKSKDGNILMSPQGIGGDDRCGVYALIKIYEESENKPYLLFTCDEEVGGVGANIFAKDWLYKKVSKDLDKIRFMIEIDREGIGEAVYYSCDNPKFEDFISDNGFITEWGTYSDIESIMPIMGIAGVNLSAGYYNQHTKGEYINLEHLQYTIDQVKVLLTRQLQRFEYVKGEDEWGGLECDTASDTPQEYSKYFGEDYWEDAKNWK